MVGEQTGSPFSTGKLTAFTFSYNSGGVVMLASNNTTGKIVAIDIQDKDSTQAATNTITSPINNFASQIASQMGTSTSNIGIVDMEVNPVSKSVYILVYTFSTTDYTLFKATNGGNTIAMVNLTNVKYCEMTFSTTSEVLWDMTYGDNALYISFSHSSGLDGKIATMTAPFVHGSSFTSRATTVFKTNWGSMYFTDAPLETMAYGIVDGEKRLMGVTTCAPGFSFKTSDISGSGLQEVKEWFNLNSGAALKAFCIYSGAETYLIEVHNTGRITRVAKRFLNETGANFNSSSQHILVGNGTTVASGLTDADVKIVAPAGTYIMAAKYTNSQLLVMSNTGAVSLLNI